MQFLPDVYIPCDVCHGTRYNRETLQVHFKGLNIAEALDLTVSEGLEIFGAIPAITSKLKTLDAVGLGYIRLGQLLGNCWVYLELSLPAQFDTRFFQMLPAEHLSIVGYSISLFRGMGDLLFAQRWQPAFL
jgi:hypothetical protein